MAEGKNLVLRAAEIWEKRAKTEKGNDGKADCYSHAAIAYSKIRDHGKAAECYKKAAKSLEASDVKKAAGLYFKAGNEMELFGDKVAAGRGYGRGAVLLERESLKASYSEPEQAKLKKEAATAYLKVMEINPEMIWHERTAKELMEAAEILESKTAKKRETAKNH